jgi:hypothetical protein
MGPSLFSVNPYSNGGLYDHNGGNAYFPPPPPTPTPEADNFMFMDSATGFAFMDGTQFDYMNS